MRSRMTKMLIVGVALIAAAAAPTTALAKPHHNNTHRHHHARLLAADTTSSDQTSGTTDATAESGSDVTAETGGTDADAAQQAAACQTARIDPNGNVQYDDVTGSCSIDAGGSDSQQQP